MKLKLSAILATTLLLLTSCSSPNNTTDPSPSPVAIPSPTAFKSSGDLKVHYIDVGQGDSVLIQTPGGKVMLIDAGKKEAGNKVVDYIKSLGISKIDALVNTYPDDEHLGGMPQVANSFDIGSLYIPRKSSASAAQKEFLNIPKIKELEKSEAIGGISIEIDPAVGLKILAPNTYDYTDIKDFSAVIKLTYGDNSFLFTGDAQSTSEKEMLSKNLDLKSTVLKVSDHGSSTATTPEFLSAVSPKYAVISVGKGNSNGFPSKDTLDKLTGANAQVYRTDETGTIIASTDGFSIKFDKVTASQQASTPAASPVKSTKKP